MPKRSKIEAKIQHPKKATQDDLGAVLERSWVDLGPILGSIWAHLWLLCLLGTLGWISFGLGPGVTSSEVMLAASTQSMFSDLTLVAVKSVCLLAQLNQN